MSEPIALVDMDGTLCDFDGAMRESLEAMRSPYEPGLPDDIHSDAPGMGWLRERRRRIKSVPGWWRALQPLDIGLRIVGLLRSQGFEIHILTKGPWVPTAAWAEKVEWVRNWLVHDDIRITITEDKGLVYGKVLADDWPPYIVRWLEWRPRGLVLMPAQRWNAGFEHPNVLRVTREDVPSEYMAECSSRIRDAILAARDRKDGEHWR